MPARFKLLNPEIATISPVDASASIDPYTGQGFSHTKRSSPISVRVQVEYISFDDKEGAGGIEEDSLARITFDKRLTDAISYTPKHGDLLTLSSYDNGTTEDAQLYLSSPTIFSYGQGWRGTVKDRSPARKSRS